MGTTCKAIRLAGTPEHDHHNSGATGCVPSTANASNPCDAISTAGMTPINGADTPSLMAGRSFAVTVTFGLAPKGR